MDRPRENDWIVFRSEVQKACLLQQRRLAEKGLKSRLLKSDEDFVVVVSDLDLEEAQAVIASAETSDSTAHLGLTHANSGTGSTIGVAVYALSLLLFEGLARSGTLGWNWVEAGIADAEKMRLGELWRAVTALCLHSGGIHLVSNLLFGSLLGYFVSRTTGAGVGWLLILLSGALGNVLNAWIQLDGGHRSLGASTAIFGALGILAAIGWRRRTAKVLFRFQRWTPVVGAVALLSFTGLGGERTDVLAHVFGFVSGLAVGTLVGRSERVLHSRLQFAAGVLCAAGIAGCWAVAVR